MEGGPSGFIPGFTCPVLLWCHLTCFRFRLREFHPLRLAFPKPFDYLPQYLLVVRNPEEQVLRFGLFPVRSPLLRKSMFLLLPELLRCFSSPRFLLSDYLFHLRMPVYYYRRVPPFGYLRISGYLLLPAAFRSLSRLSSAPSAKASALCSFLLDLQVRLV